MMPETTPRDLHRITPPATRCWVVLTPRVFFPLGRRPSPCTHTRLASSLAVTTWRKGFIEYMEATLTSTLTPLVVGNLRSLHVHWNSCVTDEFLSWAVRSIPLLEVRTTAMQTRYWWFHRAEQNDETECWGQTSRLFP